MATLLKENLEVRQYLKYYRNVYTLILQNRVIANAQYRIVKYSMCL